MNFRTAFFRLVEMVSERETVRNKTQAKNSSGSEISTIARVAVVLRWLGGGSYLDTVYQSCLPFGENYCVLRVPSSFTQHATRNTLHWQIFRRPLDIVLLQSFAGRRAVGV